MDVIIDIYEPIEIYEGLIREGVPVTRRHISPADIVLGEIGIERKTIHDFISSLIRKRLFDQIYRLYETYGKPLLLLEGDLNEIYEYKNYRAYQGAILSIIIEIGVPMVFSKDKDDTISIIKNIWLRMMETGMKTVIRYKPRLVSDDDYKLFIIQGLPNIGPRLADRLLKKFRTVRKVFTSNMYDLKDVEGIGERKAREIIRIITEPYKGKS